MTFTDTLTALRHSATWAERLNAENLLLHRLLERCLLLLCACTPTTDGYRSTTACVVHRAGGREQLLEEARQIPMDLPLLDQCRAVAQRPALRASRCSCRRHHRHPQRHPWPTCAKHGRRTR